MNYQAIIQEAKNWVETYIQGQEPVSSGLCFHNLDHITQVVEAVEKISAYYHLSDEDHFIVQIAAYFHDVGYFSGPANGHELRSAELAGQFLSDKQLAPDLINRIKSCIVATKMPQNPQNLLEEILCDADLFHLGSDLFADRNKLMRKEVELCVGKSIDKSLWRKGTIDLMEHHHYHTTYAKQYLNEKKQHNLQSLKMKELQDSIVQTISKEKEDKKEDKKKDKDKRPERGIETMFRITSTNNQRLSDMADNKSHILITVNSIILSAIIALLLRKLDSNEHLIVPTIILLSVSLSSMVFSILATRPNIPNQQYSIEELKEKKVNLLFFGNFYKMSLEDYDKGMRIVMDDRDFLYGTLIKDVYSQGVVLARKYRSLRIAYNVFMFGLIISVLAFMAVFII